MFKRQVAFFGGDTDGRREQEDDLPDQVPGELAGVGRHLRQGGHAVVLQYLDIHVTKRIFGVVNVHYSKTLFKTTLACDFRPMRSPTNNNPATGPPIYVR
jgi:hypothetical protein